MRFNKVLAASALAALLVGAGSLPASAADAAVAPVNAASQCDTTTGTCPVAPVDPAAAFGGYNGDDREVVDPTTGLPVDNPFSEESYDRVVAGNDAVSAPAEEPEVNAPVEEEQPTTEADGDKTTEADGDKTTEADGDKTTEADGDKATEVDAGKATEGDAGKATGGDTSAAVTE